MDIIIAGGLAGMIGYLTCGLTNLILYLTGILPTTGIHYNAVLMTAPNTPISTLSISIGIIAGLIVTGPFVGVIISYLLTRTSYDYAWLKGFGVATVLWPVHVAIIPNVIAPHLWTTLPPIMVFACFFFEAIFGIVTALSVKYLRNRKGKIMPHGS
jgi:hypothetical protein